MTQPDIRGAPGTKRARSEGPRSEGDWTCPLCGNVNFAFRSTCNMRKCGASKPAEPTPRAMAGPMGPSPYDQPPPGMYMTGPGVPPPLPMGMNGGYGPVPLPPPVSGVPYDYGGAMNLPSPYSPLPMPGYGPPGMIGGGPGYGGPVLDGYGLPMGLVRGPPMPGPRPGMHMEENGSRKRRGGPDGSSEGDWICPKCGNSNFAFRTFCNMRKCGTPKPLEPAPRALPFKNASQAPPPEGSWTCDACGNVNYPFRAKCNRRNCGAEKPMEPKLALAAISPPSD